MFSSHYIIIATINRPRLSASIASIVEQTVVPTKTIIVSDSEDNPVNAEELRDLINCDVLSNRRKKGLSGALNTGIDHILRKGGDADSTYISFLDDDDTWAENYLEQVQISMCEGADMIAGSLDRIDGAHPQGVLTEPPSHISCGDFLVGNTGIQGSNLTVRLSLLLKAGMFDENLLSCTDRDLCIRLCDLRANYMGVSKAVVHHNALDSEERLSTSGSVSKLSGLTNFFNKYRWRMSDDEYRASEERAIDLFDWQPTSETITDKGDGGVPFPTTGDINLCFGIIVDGGNPHLCMNLLEGIDSLRHRPSLLRCSVVLLENGDPAGFRKVVERAYVLGLNVYPIDLSSQRAVADSLPIKASAITQSKPIAVSRTLLQRFTYDVARFHDSYAWIFDDDYLFLSGDVDYLDNLLFRILHCQEQGYGVVIGGNTGSPPVPELSIMRTQVLDVVHFFQGVGLHGDGLILDYYRSPNFYRNKYVDFHYDLTKRETDILETPICVVSADRTISGALRDLLPRMGRIFAGEGVTRSVEYARDSAERYGKPTTARGGNSLIFDINLLRNVPNISPVGLGGSVRRSDMLWSINIREFCDTPAISFPLPLLHDRSSVVLGADDGVRKLVDDIIGYSFARAYGEVISNFSGDLSLFDCADIRRRAGKYVTERFSAFRLSLWRCAGLLEVLVNLLDDGAPWLCELSERDYDYIEEFLVHLDARACLSNLGDIERQLDEKLASIDIEDFMVVMELVRSGSYVSDSEHYGFWFERVRFELCCRVLDFSVSDCVFLGLGAEGVIIRRGDSVYKIFDGISGTESFVIEEKLLYIRGLSGQTIFPEIVSVFRSGDFLVCEYVYESLSAYEGGCGKELFRLLCDLRAYGLSYTNFKPSNLMLGRNGLQIVDIGRSIVKYTAEVEELSIRRAYLCWKNCSGLPQLLTASLTSATLPELSGYNFLRDAVVGGYVGSKLELDSRVSALVAGDGIRVLDYGCGKPRLEHDAYAEDCGLLAYDIDDSLEEAWSSAGLSDYFIFDRELLLSSRNEGSFDKIICSLVLCAVGDIVFSAILDDLFFLSSPTCELIISICDPAGACVCNTTFQERLISGIDISSAFSYRKISRGTGCERQEFHRPLDFIYSGLESSGFRVIKETCVCGIDIDHFTTASEFLIFEVRKS